MFIKFLDFGYLNGNEISSNFYLSNIIYSLFIIHKNVSPSVLGASLSGLYTSTLFEAKASKGMHQVCIEKSPDRHLSIHPR